MGSHSSRNNERCSCLSSARSSAEVLVTKANQTIGMHSPPGRARKNSDAVGLWRISTQYTPRDGIESCFSHRTIWPRRDLGPHSVTWNALASSARSSADVFRDWSHSSLGRRSATVRRKSVCSGISSRAIGLCQYAIGVEFMSASVCVKAPYSLEPEPVCNRYSEGADCITHGTRSARYRTTRVYSRKQLG